MSDHAAGDPGQQPPPISARYGLVRPRDGRYVAGVCAAVGRATRTDPVLWRVLLAVLICFGGIGALAYLALWLLTPEEGDTASPVEALLGRGHSQTPPVLAAVLAVAAALLLVLILPRPVYLVLLGAAAVLVVLLLHHRATGARPTGPPPTPPAAPPPGAPESGTPAAGGADFAPAEPAGGPGAEPGPGTPESGVPDAGAPPPAAESAPPSAATGTPAEPESGPPPPLFPPGRPYPPPGEAFAPHGPFAGPPPAAPPPPPRERSALSGLTFSAMLVALGLLGSLDLAGVAAVPATGYVATGLVVVGAGLLIGAWWGRARSLIALGTVLALALPVVEVASAWQAPTHPVGTSITWTPASAAELADRYEITFGEGELDLRQVDFRGESAEVTVAVSGGEIQVRLPREVPVTVDVDVVSGNAMVFGEEVNGLSNRQTVTDPGVPPTPDPEADPSPAPAGEDYGELTLHLRVRFGHIEVAR